MYYIISSLPIDEIRKYHIPYTQDGFNRDIEKFTKTSDGKKFLEISPLKIYYLENRKNLLEEVTADIFLLGLVYNQPLYIGILSDNKFNNFFDLGIQKYMNFDKCVEMQEKGLKSSIPKSERYMNGDFDTICNVCRQKMDFNLKKNPYSTYILSKKGIIKCDT